MSMNTSLNLFDRMAIDFQEVEYTPPNVDLQPSRGWTWSCDSQGRYISCSPETGEILGIAREAFTGEALVDFALTPDSTESLKAAMEAGGIPLELRLDYLRADGLPVPVCMHITSSHSESGEQTGWHGFALEVHAEGRQTAAPKNGNVPLELHQTASSMILDILDNLKKVSPAIIKYPKSSVTVNEQRETPYAGASAEEAVLIEHKLKWGRKFDLDYDEDLFIRRSKFSARGLRGALERLSAPNKILKCDLRWIAVNINLDKAGAKVWVDYPQGDFLPRKIKLSAFLEDPDILMPEIQHALDHPWETTITYRLGVDYLINPDATGNGVPHLAENQNNDQR